MEFSQPVQAMVVSAGQGGPRARSGGDSADRLHRLHLGVQEDSKPQGGYGLGTAVNVGSHKATLMLRLPG